MMLTQLKDVLAASLNGQGASDNPIVRTVREIPLSQLKIDHAYQRDLNGPFVEYLVNHWNPAAVGLLRVAERPNFDLHLTDGQHRYEAMIQMGMTHALCYVTSSSGAKDEAQQFLDTNKHRPVQLVYIFRALLQVGDEEAVAINELAKRAGWRIRGDNGTLQRPGETRAVAALQHAYRRSSAALFHALRLLIQTWPEDSQIGVNKIVRGTFLFVYYGGDLIKPSRFAKVLSGIPLPTMVKRGDALAAEHGLTTGMGFARALAVQYNKGLKPEQRITFDQAD